MYLARAMWSVVDLSSDGAAVVSVQRKYVPLSDSPWVKKYLHLPLKNCCLLKLGGTSGTSVACQDMLFVVDVDQIIGNRGLVVPAFGLSLPDKLLGNARDCSWYSI